MPGSHRRSETSRHALEQGRLRIAGTLDRRLESGETAAGLNGTRGICTMRERTNEVKIERDSKVTMADGAVLLADIYHPVGVEDAPTILERTPYGRRALSSGSGPEFAARGYRY